MANIDPLRFWRWFDELATIGRTDTGWNRLAWSPLEAEARAWFTGVATEIGLEIRRDGAGTLWAVTPDADDGPWVCAGSHLDTQPNGGAYDGALGVVSALEAAAALIESGTPRRHPLAVVAFVDEEGARFRVPCFASLAITGGLDIDRVLAAMGDAPAIYDVTAESLRESTAQLAKVRAMLEVHVEQGLNLESRELALGVATVLAPRQRWKVVFHGSANHAGTTMMDGRDDALVAAAPFVLAVDAAARRRPGAVGTVGKVEVLPGSTNSVPGLVTVSLDARALDVATVDEIVAELRAQFPAAEFSPEARNDGAAFDPALREMLTAAARGRAIPAGDLPSYAGHDSGILAPHVPAAMVFVRNPTGASHTPEESARREDCEAGVQVLADALALALDARVDRPFWPHLWKRLWTTRQFCAKPFSRSSVLPEVAVFSTRIRADAVDAHLWKGAPLQPTPPTLGAGLSALHLLSAAPGGGGGLDLSARPCILVAVRTWEGLENGHNTEGWNGHDTT